MKPILVPILDISYYLPEFSGFNWVKNLFKDGNYENEKNKFKLNLDIDKVLKTYDQNVQDTISETSKEKEENDENYLITIYKKSNPVLYQKLLNIANNLEFGKEEEFAYDPVEIKKAFNERKAAIEQMQINARKVAPKQGAGSANSADASAKSYDWE